MVTVNGYFEGTDNDIGWHKVDDEVNEFIVEQMKSMDTILFGRKTFEVMEKFWPSKKAVEADPIVAGMMGEYKKIVFSTTRDKSNWENTLFVRENAAAAITKLKSAPGKDISVFGSADLCRTLIQNNLIDEFRLMLNPVTTAGGSPFFHAKMDLQLLRTKVFGNGNVLLCYRNGR